MKQLLPFWIAVVMLASCVKEADEDTKNSGLLKSITSFAGDSAQLSFQYQKFVFLYDDMQRVVAINSSSENITTNSQTGTKFFYNGSSMAPYLMIDSTGPTNLNSNHSIRKTNFYYGPDGRKIKDSSYRYWRPQSDPNNIIYPPVSQNIVNLYTYGPQYDTRQMIQGMGTGLYIDSMYYGINNDYKRIREGIYALAYDDITYYDVENPMAALNISKSVFNIWSYWSLNFHPFHYDLNRNTHLAKSVETLYYEASNNQKINVEFYYQKNDAGKIIKLVLPKRRRYMTSGTLFDFYYTNYELTYYP